MAYSNYDWGDVYYTMWDGENWTPRYYMGSSTPNWQLYSPPDIEIGSDYLPQMVYGQKTGDYPYDLNYFVYAKAVTQACTSWAYTYVGNDGLRRGMLDLALDETNQPHIVYEQTNRTSPFWYRIVYRRPDGSEKVIRHMSYPRCTRPRIAYRNGTVHICWYEVTDNATDIMYASSPPYGDFPVSRLSTVGWNQYCESPGMGISPDGTPYIVYLVANYGANPARFTGLYMTRPGWSNGIALETFNVVAGDLDFAPPAITWDHAGNRYVGWSLQHEGASFLKKNDLDPVEYNPYGRIDVSGNAAATYYARTAGCAGLIWFEQLAGQGANSPPTIGLYTPPAQNAEANTSYTITWTDEDPDNNAVISLYYDVDNVGYNGTAITGAQNLQEDPDGTGDQYSWNVSSLPDNGSYWVYARITDGVNPAAMTYSPGYLFVNHANDPPWIDLTAPASADTAQDLTYVIRWNDGDPDDDATVSLYYSPVNSPTESTLIASGISENNEDDAWTWNTTGVPPGTYRIYAKITDGSLSDVSHSSGTVVTLQRVTYSPVDDASAYVWDPNAPHGAAVELDWAGDDDHDPSELAYLKFQITNLQYGVITASLKVYCVGDGGGGGIHFVSNTTWTEETLTWNNRPTLSPTPVSSLPWVYTGNWYAYDVTPLITGNGTFSMAVRSTDPDAAHVASKEYSTEALRPYLELYVSGAPQMYPPTAVIDSIIPNPVIQGFHPQVAFHGSGWDNDEGGASITSWRWVSSLNGQIGTSASFTRTPTSLAVGMHTITFAVKDDENVWSLADTSYLEVREPDSSPPIWPNGTGVLAVQDIADGGSVKLYWNAAADPNPPIRYNVYYNTSSPPFSGTCLADVEWSPGLDYACTFVIPELTVDVPYYFGVRAEDLVGNEDGNTVELSCTPSESGPPSFVEEPSVSEITYASALISWSTDEPTTGIIGYWTDLSDSTAVVDQSLATEHAFRLVGLVADTTYFYRVYAIDASENQVESDIGTFATVDLPTYSYLPTDDAYVSSAEPNANFGSSTLLLVSEGQISYLRFDIPDLGGVSSAELRLVAATSGDTATVWPVASTTWEEETITWNTRPFLGGSAIGGIPDPDPAQTYAVDLSNYMTEPGAFSIALNGPPTRGCAFYSKEHPASVHQPRLVVVFQADTEPPSTVTGLTSSMGILGLRLSWQPASDNVGVSGYRIYRNGSAYFGALPDALIATTQNTTYTDIEGLGDPNIDHFYRVTAFDAAGNESAPSNLVGEKEYALTASEP